MAGTAALSFEAPSWSQLGSAQIRRAWMVLDEAYQADPWVARYQGARAAAEWTLGITDVSPITNERKTPDMMTCRWEGARAAMRERGVGADQIRGISEAHRKEYARGVLGWMFWWTGLETLPGWLLRVQPGDPLAS